MNIFRNPYFFLFLAFLAFLALGFSKPSFAQNSIQCSLSFASSCGQQVSDFMSKNPFGTAYCRAADPPYDTNPVYSMFCRQAQVSSSSSSSVRPLECAQHLSIIILNGQQTCGCPGATAYDTGRSCDQCSTLPSEEVTWGGGDFPACNRTCSWEQQSDSTCTGQGSTQSCTATWGPSGSKCIDYIPDGDRPGGGSSSSQAGGGSDGGGGGGDGDGGSNSSGGNSSGGSNSSSAGGSSGGGGGGGGGGGSSSGNGSSSGGDGSGSSGSNSSAGGGTGGNGSASSGANSSCPEGQTCNGSFEGGQCSADSPLAPKCEGDDAVACAVAVHTWTSQCQDKLWQEGLLGTDEYRNGDSVLPGKGGTGDGDKNVVGTEETEFRSFVDDLSRETFLSAGCPAPFVVSAGKFGSLEFSVEPLCNFAGLLRPLIIALGVFLSGLILIRGIQ